MCEKLNSWQTRNAKLTRELCNDLLVQLKQRHLDPVLLQLRGKEGAKLSFEDIIGGYNRIKADYEDSAIGAKDVIAAVFFEFHPVSSAHSAYSASKSLNLSFFFRMLESSLCCLRFSSTFGTCIHKLYFNRVAIQIKLMSSSKSSCRHVISLMKIRGENRLIQIVMKIAM